MGNFLRGIPSRLHLHFLTSYEQTSEAISDEDLKCIAKAGMYRYGSL